MLVRVIPRGDVVIEGGRVKLTETLGAYVRVKLMQRFRFFLGEWFRDVRKGIPYYREVLGKTPNIGNARSVFRSVLQSVPEIVAITRFDIAINTTTRKLSFDFDVTLTDGTTLLVRPTEDDFILDLT